MIKRMRGGMVALGLACAVAAFAAEKPVIVFNDDVDVVVRAMKLANATNCTRECVNAGWCK